MSCQPGADTGTEADAVRVIQGGQFEASGAAYVPGTNTLLFVDDDRPAEVFLLELAPDGTQVGSASSVRLGASVTDPEGITSDGRHFYVVGSLSKQDTGDVDDLVRFVFDTVAHRVERVEGVRGLKAWLTTQLPELRDDLNIEGLAWDPIRARLLLGLRAPVVADSAVIVPIALVNRDGVFSLDNVRMDGSAIHLPLNGAGIRSLEYDVVASAFRLIAAEESDRANRGFRLMEWDGTPGSPVTDLGGFPRRHKPEGVARAGRDSSAVTVVVFDTGHFIVIP